MVNEANSEINKIILKIVKYSFDSLVYYVSETVTVTLAGPLPVSA